MILGLAASAALGYAAYNDWKEAENVQGLARAELTSAQDAAARSLALASADKYDEHAEQLRRRSLVLGGGAIALAVYTIL